MPAPRPGHRARPGGLSACCGRRAVRRRDECSAVPCVRPPCQPFSTLTIVLPRAAGELATAMPALFIASILFSGGAGAAGDDGAGMAHAPARRRGGAGDEADHRLLGLAALHEVRGPFLARPGRPADLANHDDRLGLLVLEEELEAVDEIGAVDGIAADADAARLAEAGRR